MSGSLAIEHDDKVYKIGLDDLANYEVADDAEKQKLLTARDVGTVDSDDEVEGFYSSPTTTASGTGTYKTSSSWIVR